MAHGIYHNHKERLKEIAADAWVANPGDKPMLNQTVNDALHFIKMEISHSITMEHVSEKRGNQYKKWLTNYCCKLHK